MNSALRLLRRRPHYRRLWFANLTSQLGDWLTYVAASVLAVERGQGAIAVALVLLAHQLPQALLSPLAGAITDRYDRKKVMLAATTTQAALTALMALAAAFDALLLMQAALALRMSLTAFFDTAESASTPRLVEKEEISLANSFSAGTWSITFSLGVALGGLLVALIGPIAAITVDAITFIVASLLLTGLPAIPPQHDASTSRPTANFISELTAAWNYADQRPELLTAVLAKAPLAFATGAALVYLVERSTQWALLGAGAITLGILHAVRGIGTGLGPIAALSAESRGTTPNAILAACALTAAAGITALALSNGPGLALVAVLLWGMGSGANWVKSTSMLQTLAPDGFRGRLAAIDLLLSAFAVCAGALSAAAVIDAGAPGSAAPMLGIFCGAIAFTAAYMYSQRLRNSLA